MISRFFFNKLFRCLSILLLFNSSISPVKSSSALAAWSLNSNGILELRTKSNSKLKAYFQKGGNIFGDRFWIDFPGELKTPRTIKGNGPIKEIRLGKPIKGKTRLVVEFSENNNLTPLNWRLVATDQNRWKIKLFTLPKKSFQTIGEGLVSESFYKSKANLKTFKSGIGNYEFCNYRILSEISFMLLLTQAMGAEILEQSG